MVIPATKARTLQQCRFPLDQFISQPLQDKERFNAHPNQRRMNESSDRLNCALWIDLVQARQK